MSGTNVAPEPSISIETIARLFRDVSFKNKSSRITHQSLELSKEYISLFIEEAITRSNEERVLEGETDKVRETGTRPEHLNYMTLGLSPIETQDIDLEEDYNTQDRFAKEAMEATDVIDSRHLAKIAGILVLDF